MEYAVKNGYLRRAKMDTDKSKFNTEYLENHSTLIGTRPLQLVDPETGQVLELIQTTKLRYGSKPFWKCYQSF